MAPLFGYPLLLDNPEALAHSQFPAVALAAYDFTQRDKEYSDFLATLWTNFAKHWFVDCIVEVGHPITQSLLTLVHSFIYDNWRRCVTGWGGHPTCEKEVCFDGGLWAFVLL